jgi:hypothetical protein
LQFVEEGSIYEEEERADGVAVAQEGLGIAKLGISSKIIDRLASKDITKLFPIQVMRNGGSSSLFWLKMNHIIVDVHDWIKARRICTACKAYVDNYYCVLTISIMLLCKWLACFSVATLVPFL